MKHTRFRSPVATLKPTHVSSIHRISVSLQLVVVHVLSASLIADCQKKPTSPGQICNDQVPGCRSRSILKRKCPPRSLRSTRKCPECVITVNGGRYCGEFSIVLDPLFDEFLYRALTNIGHFTTMHEPRGGLQGAKVCGLIPNIFRRRTTKPVFRSKYADGFQCFPRAISTSRPPPCPPDRGYKKVYRRCSCEACTTQDIARRNVALKTGHEEGCTCKICVPHPPQCTCKICVPHPAQCTCKICVPHPAQCTCRVCVPHGPQCTCRMCVPHSPQCTCIICVPHPAQCTCRMCVPHSPQCSCNVCTPQARCDTGPESRMTRGLTLVQRHGLGCKCVECVGCVLNTCPSGTCLPTFTQHPLGCKCSVCVPPLTLQQSCDSFRRVTCHPSIEIQEGDFDKKIRFAGCAPNPCPENPCAPCDPCAGTVKKKSSIFAKYQTKFKQSGGVGLCDLPCRLPPCETQCHSACVTPSSSKFRQPEGDSCNLPCNISPGDVQCSEKTAYPSYIIGNQFKDRVTSSFESGRDTKKREKRRGAPVKGQHVASSFILDLCRRQDTSKKSATPFPIDTGHWVQIHDNSNSNVWYTLNPKNINRGSSTTNLVKLINQNKLKEENTRKGFFRNPFRKNTEDCRSVAVNVALVDKATPRIPTVQTECTTCVLTVSHQTITNSSNVTGKSKPTSVSGSWYTIKGKSNYTVYAGTKFQFLNSPSKPYCNKVLKSDCNG